MSLHEFDLLDRRDVPEINSQGSLYRHRKTGAELLSMVNQDENKVFGIAFRTPPSDSAGLPHIMEHAVLCGSRKYPVKEPFVELLKGSLKTFLNAFTAPDFTIYPCASQNLQDFYNLVDVYLDAVLHPLIPPHILEQEGWHYELNSPDGPLQYKGVVFNEMKGVYSDPNARLGRVAQHLLFPDNAYGHDSAGNPGQIPNLTYAQFKQFHEMYYHPSNARIYFYGDDPPEARLRLIDACLQGFDPLSVNSMIERQASFERPVSHVERYPASPEEGAQKSMLTVNWMLPESTKIQLSLSMQILSHTLLGTPGSPLRKALIDSGLGEELAGGGLSRSLQNMTFSVGLKGIDKQDADRVESLVLDTLGDQVRQGLDQDAVEAAINTIEFRLREQNTGSFPRGLAILLESLSSWLHGSDPFAPLAFAAPLNSVRESIQDEPGLLENLIEGHLLNNPHRVRVLLIPDPELQAQEQAQEQARLDAFRETLSTQDLEELAGHTAWLKAKQEAPDSPEDLATLPVLNLEDLDKEARRIPTEESQLQGTMLLDHDLFTNGILYLDLAFNLQTLPQDLLPYTKLFGRALLEMGAGDMDYVQLSREIARSTGGIRTGSFTSTLHRGDGAVARFTVRGKATTDKAGRLLDLLAQLLLKPNLSNRDRFHQMVLEEKARRESILVRGGAGLVDTRLRARFNTADWASEQIGGVNYLFFLRDLAERVQSDWPAVQQKLEAIHSALIGRSGLVVNLTLDAENAQQFRGPLSEFLAKLPEKGAEIQTWSPSSPDGGEGLMMPSKINFVGKGLDLYGLGYVPHGSIFVILKYLRTTWFWDKVRVQGGAYGGAPFFDRHSGVLTYLSWRDPNLLETLAIFDRTGEFLRSTVIHPNELRKSIIGVIGDMDAYQLPDAKGYTALVRYLVQETYADRQGRRDEVLATTADDFREFADLLAGLAETAGQVVVLGSPENLEAANAGQPGFLRLTRVL